MLSDLQGGEWVVLWLVQGSIRQQMITNEIINRAIDYILQHIEEEISVETVAEQCHFSKYYLCRIFKTQTGEGVYEFIRRVRLEQSAFRLKTERERSITAISADYGYSSSNYSTAFKLHYHTTPVIFRKNSLKKAMSHPFFHQESWQTETFEECNRKMVSKEIPDYHVIYERRFGSYEELSRRWGSFLEKYGEYLTEDTKFLERTYDDPAVTQEKNCLYDICISVGKDCLLENTTTIQGGRCMVYPFKAHAKYIYGVYQTIFLEWLPRVSYELDRDRSLFDIYHVVNCDTMYMEMEICVPVRE